MAALNTSLVFSHLIASIQSLSKGSTGTYPGLSSSIILPGCFDVQCLFQWLDSAIPHKEHTRVLCVDGMLTVVGYGGTLINIINIIKGTLTLNHAIITNPKTPEYGLCTQKSMLPTFTVPSFIHHINR